MNLAGEGPTRRFASATLEDLQRIDDALGCYRHLAKVRTFVDSKPGPTVTLTGAAQAIGISRSHLARLFQQKVGTSFHHWLRLRRIRLAMSLMHERPITPRQIADLAGFTSYRTFARTFKDIVGVPPSIYRKQVNQTRPRQVCN